MSNERYIIFYGFLVFGFDRLSPEKGEGVNRMDKGVILNYPYRKDFQERVLDKMGYMIMYGGNT